MAVNEFWYDTDRRGVGRQGLERRGAVRQGKERPGKVGHRSARLG